MTGFAKVAAGDARTPATADVTFDIPLDRLRPAGDNVRGDVGDITELAQSIASLGLLEPLVVTKINDDDGGYEVICGNRRLAAAAQAGLQWLPAIVREFTAEQRVEAMVVENLQRDQLTPLEEGRGYQRLVDLGLPQRVIATRVGKSQGHISKRLSLLKLPADAVAELDSGGISIEDALELLKLEKHPARLKAAFKERHGYGGVAVAVSRHLGEVRRDKEVAAKIAELEATGAKVLRLRGQGWNAKPPEGCAFVNGYYGGDRIHVDADEHERLDCHAVAVHPSQAAIVALCTNPAAHPLQHRDDWEAARAEEAEQRRCDQEQAAAAASARIETVRKIVAGRPAKDDVAEITLAALLWPSYDFEHYTIAMKILGLADTGEQSDEDDGFGDPDVELQALLERAGKSDVERARVTVALAAAMHEERLSHSWQQVSEEIRLYYAVLERHGYEPTAAERSRLDGKEEAL